VEKKVQRIFSRIYRCLAIGGMAGRRYAVGNSDNLVAILTCVVRCGDAGRIETAAAAIYEGSADRFIAGAAEQGNHQ
jgi:hypothetical protein